VRQETPVWAFVPPLPVEGAAEPEPKVKPSSLSLDCDRVLDDCELPLEPEDVAAWPGWPARARNRATTKPTAAVATASSFAPAARRRAASILDSFTRPSPGVISGVHPSRFGRRAALEAEAGSGPGAAVVAEP